MPDESDLPDAAARVDARKVDASSLFWRVRMRTLALPLALLAGLALVPTPAQADAGETCVTYAYVADYHWYRACADPKDTACAVYLQEQHGVTVTNTCLVGVPGVETQAQCSFIGQDLDYTHHVCVDASDRRCPVYTLRTSGGSSSKTCLTDP